MTFKEYSESLEKELDAQIEIEGDACAFAFDSKEGNNLNILIQGMDDQGKVLMTADLGAPPPENLERLYRTLLEANDLFRDTGGATLSLDPATGHVRLQRYDDMNALFEFGPAKALTAFADFASAWSGIVIDYRDTPKDQEEPLPYNALSDMRV